ncbi:MAG: DUF86 domain-containing protein [Bacteroidaceae bacterium]|nr:DUF86 domain-containing protein [Bacteroidaceae bacterium]
MDEILQKYLYDVLGAVTETLSYFDNSSKHFNEFASNLMLRRAVERNIEIMGEAMNRILRICPDIRISNARKIVDTRNYIIHAYDSLSSDILWSIIINHLPLLKTEIEELLHVPT